MVYSSSLLEANFFTVAQRQEQIKMAEEAKRLLTIQQLNQVGIRLWFLLPVWFQACVILSLYLALH